MVCAASGTRGGPGCTWGSSVPTTARPPPTTTTPPRIGPQICEEPRRSVSDLIAASIYDRYAVGPSIRPI